MSPKEFDRLFMESYVAKQLVAESMHTTCEVLATVVQAMCRQLDAQALHDHLAATLAATRTVSGGDPIRDRLIGLVLAATQAEALHQKTPPQAH